MATCTASAIASYGYDANGNRVSSSGSETVATSDATVDAQDRLTSLTIGGSSDATTFAYTAGGMLRTRSVGATVAASYGYDAHGALTAVQLTGGDAVSYRNDPTGRRVRRTHAGEATRRWLWDGLRIRREVVEATGGGASTTRTFVYGTRGHTPDYLVQDGVRYRVISDHLGSVRRVLRGSDGVVVQAMDYDAWGRVLRDEALDASGALVPVGAGNVWQPLPQGYAGGLYDRTTGLVRFGARDYDSALGRWLQKDPLGFDGGDSGMYSYCGGDPVNYLDPIGLLRIGGWDGAAAGFAVGVALDGLGGVMVGIAIGAVVTLTLPATAVAVLGAAALAFAAVSIARDIHSAYTGLPDGLERAGGSCPTHLSDFERGRRAGRAAVGILSIAASANPWALRGAAGDSAFFSAGSARMRLRYEAGLRSVSDARWKEVQHLSPAERPLTAVDSSWTNIRAQWDSGASPLLRHALRFTHVGSQLLGDVF